MEVCTYEFLKLYITNSTVPEIKARNREILQTAQAIKSQRNVEVVNGSYDFLATFKLDTNFIDYYNDLKEKRKKSDKVGAFEDEKDSNYGNWDSALKNLFKYCKASATFKDITKKFAEGFKIFLSEKARITAGVPLSQTLARTECRYPILKTTFLYSCLSGMRWSDIMQMLIRQILKAASRTK